MKKSDLTTKFTKDTKGWEKGHGTPCPYNVVLFVLLSIKIRIAGANFVVRRLAQAS
jgi:hypothetical protein